MNLYEMTAEWRQVYEMLSDPEVPEEAVFDTLEMIEADMDLKAEGCAKLIRTLEGDVAQMDYELKRLSGRKFTTCRYIQRLKDRLQEAMEATGRAKITTPLFTLTVAKNGGRAPVVWTDDVPERWRKPGEPDTGRIREALENGEKLPFAALGERGKHLIIK